MHVAVVSVLLSILGFGTES